MPFASFKNVQKRLSKIHKERSQPQRRHHLGILPKKQDFRLRAKDKESKSAKIKELRSKALDKNTDEFYFNMCNSRFDMEKGHIPLDVEKSYLDSDIKSSFYKNVTHLQYELQKEKSKIHQLESKTHLLQSESQNPCSRKTPKHIVFAETYGEMVELHHKYAEKVQVDETIFDKVSSSDPSFEDIYSQRFNAYKELSEHLERAKQLKYLLRQHEAKKSLMANLTKRAYKTVFKGSKTAPPVYEFEPVRDR